MQEMISGAERPKAGSRMQKNKKTLEVCVCCREDSHGLISKK